MPAAAESPPWEQLLRASSSGLAAQLERNLHIFAGGQCGNEMERLKHETGMLTSEPGALIFVHAVEVPAIETDRSAGRPVEPGEQTKQCCLPAAARPDDGHESARLDGEADIVQYRQGTAAGDVSLRKRIAANHRERCREESDVNEEDTAGARGGGGWKRPLRFPALLPDRIIVGSACSLLVLLIVGAITGCGRERLVPAAGKSGADTAPAKAAQSSSDSTAGTRPAIIFLGTSLTAGLGLDPDDAYPALIQRKIDSAGLAFRVVNAGESGESSAGALRRVDWVLRGKPVMLVIETGANDGLRGQDPDSLRGNIESLLDRARTDAPNAQPVLAGMEALPNLGAIYARRFHAIYPAIAEKYKLPLIPFLLAGVAGVDSLNQADGIHPNIKGERIVAENVWRVVGPLLKARH